MSKSTTPPPRSRTLLSIRASRPGHQTSRTHALSFPAIESLRAGSINFSNGDTLLVRYSAGGENGFSPSSGMTSTTENLPGFGVNFNNLSEQAVGSWNHVFAGNRVNTVSLALSRLSMDRTRLNSSHSQIS